MVKRRSKDGRSSFVVRWLVLRRADHPGQVCPLTGPNIITASRSCASGAVLPI